ncbi:MFS transporter [Streptomyces laurentii]|uniref:MFS transporter n=1 Tax=Streptomyces laurentii TaxID=39478 RepID=UPI0036939103
MAAARSPARSHDHAGPLSRAGRRVGRALHRPLTGTAKGIRRATHAHGAGETGLGRLIELHAVNGAGDVMITVALASTVFFAVPTDEARGRVALYLAITMAPFTLLAPVIGPLLDRLPHGRRAAMAASMLARAVLAVALSVTIARGGIQMYPVALGVLVASKAYGVVRSAVVPRLLPPDFSLVRANSRVTLAGLLATGAAAPVAAGLQLVGPGWPLYGACAVFLLGGYGALRLPPGVDSAKGERRALLLTSGAGASGAGASGAGASSGGPGRAHGGGTRGRGTRGDRKAREPKPNLRTVGPAVLHGLQANAAQRMLGGFLIFFLAFLLRVHPLPGQTAAVSLGIVGVAAGVGNACGTAIGSLLRGHRGRPEVIIATMLSAVLATTVCAAVFFGGLMVAVLGAVAGLTQALSKLGLDALIQRDVPESVRTSAFARSETALQMAWVVGGGIGIALPLNGTLGMSVAAGILALGALLSVRGLIAEARRHGPQGNTRRARVA